MLDAEDVSASGTHAPGGAPWSAAHRRGSWCSRWHPGPTWCPRRTFCRRTGPSGPGSSPRGKARTRSCLRGSTRPTPCSVVRRSSGRRERALPLHCVATAPAVEALPHLGWAQRCRRRSSGTSCRQSRGTCPPRTWCTAPSRRWPPSPAGTVCGRVREAGEPPGGLRCRFVLLAVLQTFPHHAGCEDQPGGGARWKAHLQTDAPGRGARVLTGQLTQAVALRLDW